MKQKIKGTPARKSSRYPVGVQKIQQLPNKVSEAQTAYRLLTQAPEFEVTKILKPHSNRFAKTQKRPLPTIRGVSGVEMPDAVRQFAQKNALVPYLETALRLVHESFPSLRSIKLAYEVDWEVEDESWIAINIKVPGKTDQVLKQYLFFTRQMTQQIPPEKSGKILLGIGGLGNA